ncbi:MULTISPECIES: EamA family transporter [unclassified Rathayibacter]|uniref:EamA family transporter n=1 Tax=unclassified Rathayibacter TaxID=2609250 RepID=UPI00188BCC40|nr:MULTISPECIES: EamA family transporter [unclassified Rathayibacter]MBF4461241.1 EamA family transporter [Rathayibacter sp. VKM Ac-2879]MBF4502652.1 EamA family transporter [Rathayibacter sp. VKM Ac-2878]
MTRAGLTLTAAVAPIVWGTTYLVTTELLPPGHPLTASLLRALPAGLLLLALRPGVPPRGWRLRTLVLGLLNIGLFFPLLFVAASRLPGGVAAVVGAVQPLVVIALTFLLRWGRPHLLQVASGVVALAGVSLVSISGTASFDPIGLGAAALGTVSMAVGILLTRRWGTPPGTHPLTSTAWQLIVGGLAVAPLLPLTDHGPWQPGLAGLAGYAWLTLIGGALAYALWFRGARALPSSNVALLGVLSPVTAALLGWVVLGQALSALQLLGFALALAGSLAGQFAPAPRD